MIRHRHMCSLCCKAPSQGGSGKADLNPSFMYAGTRRTEQPSTVLIVGKDFNHPLDPQPKLFQHSSEFNWGYAGSGPAQLALAIAADICSPRDACRIHQALKFSLVGRITADSFIIDRAEVVSLVNGLIAGDSPQADYWSKRILDGAADFKDLPLMKVNLLAHATRRPDNV